MLITYRHKVNLQQITDSTPQDSLYLKMLQQIANYEETLELN